MAKLRCQIARIPTARLPVDEITNTVYFDTDELGTEPDYHAFAQDLTLLWAQQLPSPEGFVAVRTKVYNMADAKPREPRAVMQGNTSQGVPSGPYEIAACLSFFSERNLPRRRGRLYLGPWPQSEMSKNPGGPVETAVRFIANGLQNIGGANVDWCIHSPTTGAYMKVTDWWFDNEWDTQRRRGRGPISRITGETSEQVPISGGQRLTEHFVWREFWMDDGTAPPDSTYEAYERLCRRLLEPLRLAFGPVTIASGFRTPEHNRRVGGAPASRHVVTSERGVVAADVYCRSGSPRAWRDALDELGAGGLGLYPTHVHADLRRRRARWQLPSGDGGRGA